MVFPAIDLVTEGDALLGEKLGSYAGALIGRDLGALPDRLCGMPLVVEEAGLAVGRGHQPERATGDGEHGIEGVIQRVRNEGGLVDEEESYAGKATDVGGYAGQPNDTAAVGKKERVLIAPVAARLDIELAQEPAGLLDPLTGLASRGRADDHERAGVVPSVMESLDGGDSGLAPLAGATEHQAIRGGPEDCGLNGIGLPAEFELGPGDGIWHGCGNRIGPGGPGWEEAGWWGVPVRHGVRLVPLLGSFRVRSGRGFRC